MNIHEPKVPTLIHTFPRKVPTLLKSPSESTTGLSSDTEYSSKKTKGDDVWYRHVLKPLLVGGRKNLLMKEAFTRRVHAPTGIPIDEFSATIHSACSTEYSPFVGLLFAKNNSVENIYKYGDKTDPLVQLVHHLFHMLPGGEIQPTHVHRNATAHVSAAIVGAILEEWKRSSSDNLALRFLRLIADHEDYKEGRKEAHDALEKALKEQDDLTKKDEASKPYRDEIKRIEGDVIKYHTHVLKRINSNDSEKKRVEQIIEEGRQQVEALRAKYIVTSGDKKAARKAVKRAEDALKLEQENLTEFAHVLEASFSKYDTSTSDKTRPIITTKAILLACMWRKYDHISALAPYFESLSRMGELTIPLEKALSLLERQNDNKPLTCRNKGKARFRVPGKILRRSWPTERIVEATTIMTSLPCAMDRPPVIPFSYVTWAAYSKFPDCGETALRNLMNQILFNTDAQTFDAQLLIELKEKHYSKLSPRLIRFYEQNSCPRYATDQKVSLDWISVVSKLNSALQIKGGPTIRYRREDTQQNIASPLRNLLRVFNALFGILPLDDMSQLNQLVDHINELRPKQHLSLDLRKIKSDGFGTLALVVVDQKDKMVKYELHSYKPVHFGFVQVHSSSNESSASQRYEYDAFKKLMHYSNNNNNNNNSTHATNMGSSIENLGLASLFVPYQLQHGVVGKFFGKTPIYYPLVFANLEDELSRQKSLEWARDNYTKTKDTELMAWISRIENYVEPSFGPIKESEEES